MRTTIVFAVIAVAISLGCSAKRDTSETSLMNPDDWLKAEQKRVAQFQVVAYASVDTNNAPDIVLVVSEVWKGHQEARALGITNGMQFPTRWTEQADFLPDCAIIYVPRTPDPTKPYLGGGALFPKNGGVYPGVTIQKYKASFGL